MGLLLLLVLLAIETKNHRTWYLNLRPQRGSMKQEFAVTGNFFDGRDWRRGVMLESVGQVLDNAHTARNAVPQFLIRIMQ